MRSDFIARCKKSVVPPKRLADLAIILRLRLVWKRRRACAREHRINPPVVRRLLIWSGDHRGYSCQGNGICFNNRDDSLKAGSGVAHDPIVFLIVMLFERHKRIGSDEVRERERQSNPSGRLPVIMCLVKFSAQLRFSSLHHSLLHVGEKLRSHRQCAGEMPLEMVHALIYADVSLIYDDLLRGIGRANLTPPRLPPISMTSMTLAMRRAFRTGNAT